jgi:hypothetical protein
MFPIFLNLPLVKQTRFMLACSTVADLSNRVEVELVGVTG